MLKSIGARLGATATALALVGASYAAIPAAPAFAGVTACHDENPQIRTQTTISTPYGLSASKADLINAKVINSSNENCYDVTVTIHSRDGFVFHSIQGSTGAWMCETPIAGEPGDVVCHTEVLPKYSSSTIKVRYDRVLPGGPVTGTAGAELDFCSKVQPY